MKICIIIFVLFGIAVPIFGQGSKKFLIDEFYISATRTNLQNENTEDRYGFGIGSYHTFLTNKKINIILGTEFNQTTQFKKYIYARRFAHWTNVTYYYNCISIPLGLRINFGEKKSIFIETGGYIDMVIDSKQKGTFHFNPPVIDEEVYQRIERAGFPNTVGLYFGFGLKIPVSKYMMIIKADYKYGVNPLYSDYEEIFNRYFRINLGLKI